MLIYTMVVLFLILLSARPHRAQSEFYEKQLANEVMIYREFIDSGRTIEAPDEWFMINVLQTFESNVHYVLKLLSALYQWEMPSKEDAAAAAAANGGRKLVVRKRPLEELSTLKTVTCSLVPSLLSFLHICTNELSTFFRLHRLHTVLCFVTPAVVAQGCAVNADRSTYLCDANTVELLHEIRQEFLDAQMTATAEQNARCAKFVTRAFESVNGIDKYRMLTTLPHSVGPWRNVFGEMVESDFFAPHYRRLNQDNVKDLEKRLWVYNNLYAKDILTDDEYATEQKETSVSDMVNRLLALALKTFVAHFGYTVHSLTDDDWSLGRDTIVGELSIFQDNLCKMVPAVLVYIADNCDTANTATSFGLFLTLCADWNGFLNVHCPRGGEGSHERACVTNAILNRLLVNFYWATGDNLNYDAIKTYAYNYVAGTHVTLIDYYVMSGRNKDDDMPIWTSSDWLTGRHLLAHHHRGGGETVKLVTITLQGKDHHPAADVLVTEAYDMLLPWHLDARSVLAFHSALVGHERRVMDDFVYRHAEIVGLYLGRVIGSVDVMTLVNQLSDTIGWYEKCAWVFRNYLSLPVPRKPSPARPVDSVVSAIEKLNAIETQNLVDGYATVVMGSIPTNKRTELSSWANSQLSDFEETEYPQQLIRMLEENCVNAVAYMNTLIKIAEESNVIMKNTKQFQVNCNNFVTDVFAKLH